MFGESLKRLWGWNRWNKKAKECSFSCHLLCPLLLTPSLHHLASGVWTTALDGGASVLSVLSMRLRVYYRLSLPWRSPAASHFSEFHNTETKAHMQTHKPCATSEPSSLRSLSSSYVGLFVAVVPELGEENRENKAEHRRRMVKKERRWC